MRVFAAVMLPAEARKHLAPKLSVLARNPELKVVAPEQLHLTLCFVPRATAQEVTALAETLQKLKAVQFQVKIGGFGAFPSERGATVFWLGVSEKKKLKKLARLVRDRFSAAGVSFDAKEFIPHLAFARGRKPLKGGAVRSIKNKVRELAVSFPVTAVSLVESRPANGRYSYHTLATVPLGRGDVS